MDPAILRRIKRLSEAKHRQREEAIELDKQLNERFKDDSEFVADRIVGMDILKSFFNIKSEEWVELDSLDWDGRSADDAIRDKFKDMLIGGGASRTSRRDIETLEKVIDYRVARYNTLQRHPTAEKLTNASLDYEKARELLVSHPLNAELQDRGFWELKGAAFLDFDIMELIQRIQEPITKDDYAHVKGVIDQILTVHSELNQRQAVRLFTDCLEELLLKVEDRLLSDDRRSERYKKRRAVEFIVDAEPTALNIFTQMVNQREVYKVLGDAELDILTSIPRSISRQEIAATISSGVAKFKEEKIDPHIVKDLVNAAPESERLDFYERVFGRPEMARVFKAGKKGNLIPSAFVAAVSLYGEALMDKTDYIGTLTQLADVPRAAPAISLFVDHAEDFITNPHAKRISMIAKNSPSSKFLFENYFALANAGGKNRSELLLRTGEQITDPNQISISVATIRSLSEELAAAYVSNNYPISEMQKKLRTLAPVAVGNNNPPSRPKIPHGMDEIVADRAQRGIISSDQERLYHEAKGLSPGHERRFRRIYNQGLDAFFEFCQDVIDLSKTRGLDIILDSDQLFKKYEQRKTDPAVREAILNLKATDEYSAFMGVQQALLGSNPEPIDVKDVETIDRLYAPRYASDRVIVWGGQYRHQEKEKVRQSMPEKEVIFYDLFNNRSDFKGLKPTDLVVIVTSSISHSLYNSLRTHCKKNNVPCLHSRHSGIHPLSKFIAERTI